MVCAVVALASAGCGAGLEVVPYMEPEDADAGTHVGIGVDAGLTTPLEIIGLSPVRGIAEGGTEIAIDGYDFTDDITVTFGGLRAEVTFVDSGELSVVTPAHSLGAVDVVITDGGRSATLRDAFEYAPPVSPGSGPEGGETWVTILANGGVLTPEATVRFGDTPSTTVVYVNAHIIRALSPAGQPGPVDLEISTAGELLTLPAAFTYTPAASSEGAPRLVSAKSQDATHVLATFSEPLEPIAAEEPGNYGIVPLYVNDEAGGLSVISAEQQGDGSVVRLTTGIQSQVTYQLAVNNLRDRQGNAIAPPELMLDPSRAVFAGTGEGGGVPTDSDGDGVSDADEQLGWSVWVVDGGGERLERQVATDPQSPDTDGDGLLDGEERAAGSDPTRPDTDQDTLSDFDEWNRYFSDPNDPDSDGDGLNDPTELFLLSSMVLADTDGDQFDDYDEIVIRQRNPRIADLPQPVLGIGAIDLSLDLRYSYTDTRGESQTLEESYETTLQTESSSQSTTYGQWSQGFEVGAEVGGFGKWGADAGVGVDFRVSGGYNRQWTGGTDTETASSTINSYDEALSRASSFESTETVERSIEGARISVAVYLEAASDVAFTLKNMELSVMHGDPNDRDTLLPVASLRPSNADLEVNLGPGVPSQGPIIFQNDEVFPARVEALLRNPEAIVVRFANYDIVAEDGRNLAFISQDVEERTGQLLLDFGNGSVETYRVALSNEWDPLTGKPLGLRFTDALRTIGIDAGPCGGMALDPGNGVECTDDAECLAAFDSGNPLSDPVRCDTSGAYGVCVPQSFCDDVRVVDTLVDPYSERLSADRDVTETFGLRAARDGGVPMLNDEGEPILGLARIRGVQDDLTAQPVQYPGLVGRNWSGIARADYRHRWVMFSDGEASDSFAGVAFKPGGTYVLAFTVDEDGDGLYKVEEDAYGTSDTTVDFDADGLSDWEEIRGGAGPRVSDANGTRYLPSRPWNVSTDRRANYRVYPHPTSADSDDDGLSDLEETQTYNTDPTKTDTDEDGVSDADEVAGWSYVTLAGVTRGPYVTDPLDSDTDGDRLIDGIEELWETNPLLADLDEVSDGDRDGLPDARDVKCEAPLEPPDDDNDGDNDGLSDFIEASLGTDICNADTDGDGLVDLIDWDGVLDAAAEDHCINSLNCFLPERGPDLQLGTDPNNQDTDFDGLTDREELEGWVVSVRGAGGGGQDEYSRHVTSDPLAYDTDGDGLSDWDESNRGTDPRLVDTDGDGADDRAEVLGGRNPAYPDRRLRISMPWVHLYGSAEGDSAEYNFSFNALTPDGIDRSIAASSGLPNFKVNCPDYAQFSPGTNDNFVFGISGWNSLEVVVGLDQTIILHGVFDEMDECNYIWQSQWYFGGPAKPDAVVPGNIEDGTYRVFRSNAGEVAGPAMDVEIGAYIQVIEP